MNSRYTGITLHISMHVSPHNSDRYPSHFKAMEI